MSEGKKEITNIVERLDLLEGKFGITLSGIYATCEPSEYEEGQYEVHVNYDISSPNGEGLAHDTVWINANTYNASGQLLGNHQHLLRKSKFMGFESASHEFVIDQIPQKIRLFPSVA
jgi:hypothetical protein